MTLFHALVIGHVVAGTVALTSFWVPVLARKGGPAHRRWGKVFVIALTLAGFAAIGMALLNLTVERSRWPELADRDLFEGLFGWMMLYLGVLSLGLLHHGWQVVRQGGSRLQSPPVVDVAVQLAVLVAGIQCAAFGTRLGQPLMVVLALLGVIAAITFIAARLRPAADRQARVREHLKAMVAAGISAYTAFLSVGLLRVMPAHVFNPLIWAVPSVVGVTIIIVQLRRYRPVARSG